MQVLRMIEKRLRVWVTSQLAESFPEAFLVETRLRVHRNAPEVSLRIDTDTGWTLDKFVRIHLFLKERMEGLSWLPEGCHLSVASPSLDMPIKVRRQYLQKLGKPLRVYTWRGRYVRGILERVKEEGIELSTPSRKIYLRWSDIKFARLEREKPQSLN
ncbi:MAG: hypothetical protein NZ580_03700 [Bacteroidia bacterium]|nr:hypothetical protein [Bacteroidia bacterium]MDW8235153.1 hypothetical protein [Bacteroidia bacterium]